MIVDYCAWCGDVVDDDNTDVDGRHDDYECRQSLVDKIHELQRHVVQLESFIADLEDEGVI